MPKTVKEGSVWTLAGPDPLGEGNGMVMPGTVCTVEVLDKKGDLEGAGNAGESTAIIVFEEDTPMRDDEGRMKVEKRPRRLAVALDQFSDLFEEVS